MIPFQQAEATRLEIYNQLTKRSVGGSNLSYLGESQAGGTHLEGLGGVADKSDNVVGVFGLPDC